MLQREGFPKSWPLGDGVHSRLVIAAGLRALQIFKKGKSRRHPPNPCDRGTLFSLSIAQD